MPKNAFFWPVFFAWGAENLTKTGSFCNAMGDFENQFGRPKKKVDNKIFEIFLEIPLPPRENSRSAPALFNFFHRNNWRLVKQSS